MSELARGVGFGRIGFQDQNAAMYLFHLLVMVSSYSADFTKGGQKKYPDTFTKSLRISKIYVGSQILLVTKVLHGWVLCLTVYLSSNSTMR